MWLKPGAVIRAILRNSKRIGITIVGGVVVLIGLILLVLPGPGILVVAVGFAILGTEYAWAAAALDKTKKAAEATGRAARESAKAVGRKVTRRKPTSRDTP